MSARSKVRTCLRFEKAGLEAAKHYVSLLPWSTIEAVYEHGNSDDPTVVELWTALVSDGGRESMCGWLVDRFGVSWQIVPEALPRLLGNPDLAAAARARAAMMQMKKIDIAALEVATRT